MSGSCFLFNEPHRCCSPTAAVVLGEGPATVLQTLHWRLERSTHTYGGLPWVYDTYPAWHEDWFPHWSERTVKRHFASLKARGIVIIRHDLNAHAYDTTSWFTIDYGKLAEIEGLKDLLSQRSDKLAEPENQGHKPKGQSGTSPDWPTCQNGTDETLRFQHQEKTPGEDVSHTPDVLCPPAAAALAVVAPLQQATESAEEESPAPDEPAVSALRESEPAATSEAPAELLATPQGGEPGKPRAQGACVPGCPPEFGRTYRLAWFDAPQEVGPGTLDPKGMRLMALSSPTLAAQLAALYQEECAHA